MAWKSIRVGGVALELEEPAPDRITFVGSRKKEIPSEEFEKLAAGYEAVARALVPKGIFAVSGGADGMDRLAEYAFGKNVISYRTEHRDREPSFVRVLSGDVYRKAEQMVAAIHPAWSKVKPEHRALHARNMAQVLQDDLRHPTRFLVCWAPPNGLGVSGGTASAFALSKIVHDGKKTYNLATPEGKRGFAGEMRDLGVPIAKGEWYPQPVQTLATRTAQLLDEGHGRVGIVVPVGVHGMHTKAEDANLSEKYAPALVQAKSSRDAAIVGDAWNNRVVLIAVPFLERTNEQREHLVRTLLQIAQSNVLSRVLIPHKDLEPSKDNYRDFERALGREALLESPCEFVDLPAQHRGIASDLTADIARSNTTRVPEVKNPIEIRVASYKDTNLRLYPNLIYVGRTLGIGAEIGRHLRALGNPFVVGKDGERDECAAKYGDWLNDQLANRRTAAVQEAIDVLTKTALDKGSVTVVCHCAPAACHADHIAATVETALRSRGVTVSRPDLAIERTDTRQPARAMAHGQDIGR